MAQWLVHVSFTYDTGFWILRYAVVWSHLREKSSLRIQSVSRRATTKKHLFVALVRDWETLYSHLSEECFQFDFDCVTRYKTFTIITSFYKWFISWKIADARELRFELIVIGPKVWEYVLLIEAKALYNANICDTNPAVIVKSAACYFL